MAILMAATHPERVSSLVLYGSYAKRTRGEGYPWAQTDDERRSYTDRLIDSWDWEADLRMRCPSGDRRCNGGGHSACAPRQRRPRSVH